MHVSLVYAHLDNSSTVEKRTFDEMIRTQHVENNSKNTDILLSPQAVDTTRGRHPAPEHVGVTSLNEAFIPPGGRLRSSEQPSNSNPATLDTRQTPNGFPGGRLRSSDQPLNSNAATIDTRQTANAFPSLFSHTFMALSISNRAETGVFPLVSAVDAHIQDTKAHLLLLVIQIGLLSPGCGILHRQQARVSVYPLDVPTLLGLVHDGLLRLVFVVVRVRLKVRFADKRDTSDIRFYDVCLLSRSWRVASRILLIYSILVSSTLSLSLKHWKLGLGRSCFYVSTLNRIRASHRSS